MSGLSSRGNTLVNRKEVKRISVRSRGHAATKGNVMKGAMKVSMHKSSWTPCSRMVLWALLAADRSEPATARAVHRTFRNRSVLYLNDRSVHLVVLRVVHVAVVADDHGGEKGQGLGGEDDEDIYDGGDEGDDPDECDESVGSLHSADVHVMKRSTDGNVPLHRHAGQYIVSSVLHLPGLLSIGLVQQLYLLTIPRALLRLPPAVLPVGLHSVRYGDVDGLRLWVAAWDEQRVGGRLTQIAGDKAVLPSRVTQRRRAGVGGGLADVGDDGDAVHGVFVVTYLKNLKVCVRGAVHSAGGAEVKTRPQAGGSTTFSYIKAAAVLCPLTDTGDRPLASFSLSPVPHELGLSSL
ncbi:hypothetical protein EYF80_047251 [Liparis tanakae]|uniref:Uncharacterized protein n=1 Tax=Liparis tanakae TaxID=230148 RepID=A0A4Z2FP53_9TELE|nr:hypothetical protein EYF80_047251 [Liparis tanakae]